MLNNLYDLAFSIYLTYIQGLLQVMEYNYFLALIVLFVPVVLVWLIGNIIQVVFEKAWGN
ncbi:hypothetical protein [Desmospora activa]|uniref:Uncharacterized protein n=1 Tax=Desmospora activa DSM 45169 TaxID=1121389 RepID=A0A2T4YYU8_9BACL|nr:hypothetical protein [Desmospora activa]PTM51928.1 hypothetical protein C8J48_3752 [Desmospora activa DSM 45169]